MDGSIRTLCALAWLVLLSWSTCPEAFAQVAGGIFAPEQRCIEVRDPEQMPRARLPETGVPPTVARPEAEKRPMNLTLDEAIRIALENSEVVRVLQGAAVGSSGRTIYDPAIENTQIDRARSRFDPTIRQENRFERIDTPQGVLDPFDPAGARIDGAAVHQYTMGLGVSKNTVAGGTAGVQVSANPLRSEAPLPLNPRSQTGVEFSYVQPLLQGSGMRANVAPILIAQLDTERSFYDLKSSVQQLVRGVVEGYWALVFARTNVWARQQQTRQAEWAFDLADARKRRGLGDAGEVAQARATVANFRAQLITAQGDVLRREAALRNVLGLPPSDEGFLVPVTPPALDWVAVTWEDTLRTAEEYRTDLIQLKLAIQADEQQLVIARNQAMPRVDAVAAYRLDGLDGRTPGGRWIASDAGQFTGWRAGVDVSLPMGLRDSRAEMRRRELALMRNRANLQEALHAASHDLAENYRNMAQFYEQYKAFHDTREAARINLDAQNARWANGLTIYLNVLQAIASWGDAVSSEAQSLLQYNTELANLAQQTGTILEGHGIRFTEDHYRSIGPRGRLGPQPCYPMDRRPGPNEDQYPGGARPAEDSFHLDAIPTPRRAPPERQ